MKIRATLSNNYQDKHSTGEAQTGYSDLGCRRQGRRRTFPTINPSAFGSIFKLFGFEKRIKNLPRKALHKTCAQNLRAKPDGV
jgi:hypothetical protein